MGREREDDGQRQENPAAIQNYFYGKNWAEREDGPMDNFGEKVSFIWSIAAMLADLPAPGEARQTGVTE